LGYWLADISPGGIRAIHTLGINTTIAFDEKQLVITEDVIVSEMIERIQQLLSEEPSSASLGPFFTRDANVQTMKTQSVAYFTFELMEILRGSNLTDQQVYHMVAPALMDTGLDDSCSGMVDFLNVALVAPSMATPPPLSVYQKVGVTGYVTGPSTISYNRDADLYGDLPALNTAAFSPAASDLALLEVARGVKDMVDVCAEARRPQTVRNRMGDRITDRLLLLCHSDSNVELLEVYHAWGSRSIGVSERWMVHQSIEADCARKGVPPF
jgi:hypothetical protein